MGSIISCLDALQSQLGRRRQYLPKQIQNKTYNKIQRIHCERGNFPKYCIFRLKIASEGQSM
jgi:hypothetical protein